MSSQNSPEALEEEREVTCTKPSMDTKKRLLGMPQGDHLCLRISWDSRGHKVWKGVMRPLLSQEVIGQQAGAWQERDNEDSSVCSSC